MSDEAFTNAEQLFRAAYAQLNPVAELLNLIKAHPTFPAAIDLLVYYTEAVEEDPSRAEALALALAQVRKSPEAPIVDGSNLAEIFSRELADLHSRGFELDKDTSVIGPTNTYLITSLLSGLSFKHDLTTSPDQYGNLVDGLNADTSSSTSEVQVTGACIQLLINGSGIIPHARSYIESANEVSTKLKTQRSNGTVKDPNALQILELAIAHADSGFKKENDVDHVWGLLFPSRK